MRPLLTTTCLTALLCVTAAAAYANPQGGQVAGGQATITSNGNTVDINQTSNRAIINWSSFDIGADEKTVFNQPSASSIALNRVNSKNPTQILGQLDANGQVILVNPNGVFFGKDSQVDVSGLIATTANIKNNDFMAGNMKFSQPGNPNASITNQGSITAEQAGLVGFVGPKVENDGVIKAKLGKVSLSSGDTFTLDMAGDNLITVAVSGKLKQQFVKNAGTIEANGGTVALTAAAARGVVDSISNSGLIQANSVHKHNGRVILSAASNDGTSTATNSGTLSASGKKTGQTGGSVTVTADNVTLTSGSMIDVSGDIGGGYVETSGKTVSAAGHVDASATNGNFGTWLIDPATINIISGGGSDLTGSTIDPATLVSALNGTNITLTADNSITVTNAVNASGNTSSGNLALFTPTDYLNAPIALKGTLSGTATTVNVGANGLVQNGVDAAAAGGTVNLAAATYNLTNDIVINKSLTLNGESTILDGNHTSREMEILGTADGIDVTLNNLTMENGGGGGRNNQGAGGGLYIAMQDDYHAPVTINRANVTINNSTIENNSAVSAAGIDINGEQGKVAVTINNSTISGNTTTGGSAGGIEVDGTNSAGAMLTINNSTISGNSAAAGGGIFNAGGFNGNSTLIINSSTISGNWANGIVPWGAGILNDNAGGGNTTLTISNSILAGNKSNAGTVESDLYNYNGATFISKGYNLFGQHGDAGGFIGNGTTDILLQGDISWVLENLTNYGGPTQTMALVPDSVAVDAGDPALIGTTDQRGIVRGNVAAGTGTGVDIGAYELATIHVSADNQEITYGQSLPPLTYTVTSGPSGMFTGSPALNTPETNVGTYRMDIGEGTLTLTNNTYVWYFTPGTLKIDPRTVFIDPNAGQSKIYGTIDPNLTYTVAGDTNTTGLLNGDTITGKISYTGAGQYANAGSYAFTTGTLSASQNYALAIAGNAPSFNITKRSVTVDPTSGQHKTYGENDPNLTYTTAAATSTTGLVHGDTLSGSLSYTGANKPSNAGTYAFTLGTLANSNYSVLMESKAPTFSILKAILTITADNFTRLVGQANPIFTASYSGFMYNDNASVLNGLKFTTKATRLSPAGKYAIVPSSAIAANYNIKYVNGMLTVLRK